jgi:hypothetical protein
MKRMPIRSTLNAIWIPVLGLVVGVGGCAQPRAEMTLEQPHAPPSQRRLTLASDWAFVATQDARRLCLIDFALPGAVEGPRDFRVFLILPGTSNKMTIAASPAAGGCGFFIQKVGRLSGKAEFVEGTAAIDTALLRPGTRELHIDVRCADGTRIVGQARLRQSEEELRSFLQSHAADVAALDAAEHRNSALAGDPTPRRAGQSADDSANSAAESQPARSAAEPAGTE